MKASNLLSLMVLLIFVCSMSCKEEEKTDPCESTKAADKTIKINLTVSVKAQDDTPLPDRAVEVRFERHPCGASATDVVFEEENTDLQGQVVFAQQSISLKNTKDDAFITATVPNLNSSKKFSNKTYHYDDFTNGQEVHVEMEFKEGDKKFIM